MNKALLRICDRTIIEIAATVLERMFSEILIVTNYPDDFAFLGLPTHRDLIPGKGSLGGLYTGLSLCSGDRAFVIGCDMPFLNAEVIGHMVSVMGNADVLVPRISGHLEPLHAIYSKSCLPHIEELLAGDDLTIFNFFGKVKVREVSEQELVGFDPDFKFIINVNTPEDLERARSIVAGSLDLQTK